MRDIQLPRGSAIALQLGTLWLLGAAGLTVAAGVRILFLAGLDAVVIATIVVACLLAVLLWLIISLTATASYLGGSPSRRALWVMLVLGVGLALWAFGWALTDEAGLAVSADPTLATLLSGVPFVLVGGVLARGWYVNVAALVVFLGLAGFGLDALKRSGPDELTQRLAHSNIDRRTAYLVQIPGYKPTDGRYGERLGARDFVPDDPAKIPQERFITVGAFSGPLVPVPGCGETAVDSELGLAECTAEPDGLLYRRGVVQHGYQLRLGDTTVVLAGTHAVDRRLLRGAVGTVRRANAAELQAMQHTGEDLFVADVPGYRRQPLGSRSGTILWPDAPDARPHSVNITLHVTPAADVPPRAAGGCEPEPDGLIYQRHLNESHGYLVRRGTVDVEAVGGLAVDRALLRQVALAARPATDAELLRALPPAPPGGTLDRLRRWLREHF